MSADGRGCGFLRDSEIDALVEGRASEELARRFERHVERGCGRCALLHADVREFAAIVAGGATETERDAAHADVTAVRARTRRTAPARWGTPRTLVAVAASVTLGAVLWFAAGPERPGSATIALGLPGGDAFEVAPLAYSPRPVVRGELDPAELWRGAADAYEKRRYRTAAKRFEAIAGRSPEDADARLYAGVAWLAAGDADAARGALAEARGIAERFDLPLDAIAWFDAVAAIESGDTASGAETVARLAAGVGPYADRAAELAFALDAEEGGLRGSPDRRTPEGREGR